MTEKKYRKDVTIAILNYNSSEFLDRAVRSCIEQSLTAKSTEIIVIDDYSNDRSWEYLKTHKKTFDMIKIFRNNKNMGPGYCSKLAVQKAQGKYFIRVDSDDYLNKFAIDMMTNILEYNSQYGYVYCDHFRTDEWGIKQKLVKLDNKDKIFKHGAGILFRTQLIKKVGNYKSKFREAEDHDLILRINKIAKGFYLPIPLYRYYIHGKNISHSGKRSKYIKLIK
ncbi:glycosyltransferase family A protein [Candidatus Pelagibacter sp.]|jgi:glycosyltransferase involved in cell wall biosynthesis|nr:glycosyltransferase family A protein [Candidatus Pelagibacter sp.]